MCPVDLLPISSTHNTRIERLWVEVGRNFCRTWRAFFYRLEDQFGLDSSDPSHIWLLQALFLDDINTDCDLFVQEWNSHPMSGSDTHDMSPQVCPCIFYIGGCLTICAGPAFSSTNSNGDL
jgi:hypothetical protein